MGICCVASAQKQTSNWYFGSRAGLTFNDDGSVTPLDDGNLNTIEGCASISDEEGQLLFYTDGINVYNSTHSRMPNGFGLYGDTSSSQSALVVPMPENDDIFYIFTVDTKIRPDDLYHGFNYSVVDMALNDGLGDVVQKNIRLLSFCSEKITAVLKDCNDRSAWVVTLSTKNGNEGDYFDTYHAFEINSSGLMTNSVKSTFNNSNFTDRRGYLKFSPDGTKMANANVFNGLFLYDFDTTTGSLSNQQRLYVPTVQSPYAYGIEFSSNNRFLYAHTYNDDGAQFEEDNHAALLQYDLDAPNITSSVVVLDESDIFRGALQLGLNGKIYRTISETYQIGSPYLGVIHNPNRKGTAANYQHNAIQLSGLARQGLPPFIQSYFNKIDLIRNPDGSTSSEMTLCEAGTITLQADDIADATYFWQKDGVPISNNTATLDITNASEEDEGAYSVEVIPLDPGLCPTIGEAMIYVNPIPEAGDIQLIQCDYHGDTSDGLALFNLTEVSTSDSPTAYLQYYFYLSGTDLQNEISIQNPTRFQNTMPFNQTVHYKVTDGHCENTGTIQLLASPMDADNDPISFFACDDSPNDGELNGLVDFDYLRATHFPSFETTFFNSPEDALVEENQIEEASYISDGAPIYARLENSNACQGIREITMIIQESPMVSLENGYVVCTDNPNLSITAPSVFDVYTWYSVAVNGNETFHASGPIANFQTPGDYILEVGRIHDVANNWVCYGRTDFQVEPSNLAVVEEAMVSDVSDNNTVQISVTGDGVYEYALQDPMGPYQDSNTFENVPPGFLDIYIRDKKGCGTTHGKIAVIGYPKFFTPNGDNVNDYWQIQGLEAELDLNSTVSIFDKYGKLVSNIRLDSSGWNGMFNSQKMPASDYWFRTILPDGREIKGHFTLKR
ncbi:T9SS type B sorting domain-containing protein [Muricauda sp. MAR_2010_75]|uniref:T9SS type B sorting domain-containing protein n=1 Tax=Allomuricauda sp. MAR_2010_75 TaxID=1250232 RepID=UPI001E47515C|nr:T9SS type B sorting domain-containing protein [Muricauda sp. MAR_2010_75]